MIDNIKAREDFPMLLNKYNLKIGAEIGVLQGGFAKIILDQWTGDKLYLIDHWRHSPNIQDFNNSDNPNVQLDNFAKTFMTTYFYGNKCCIIKETSLNASNLFQDESLDFVYIDASHDFKNVTEDLNTWFPKIKKGGIFAGHDYVDGTWIFPDTKETCVFEVKSAVDKFFNDLNYKVSSTKDHPDCTETHATWWIIK